MATTILDGLAWATLNEKARVARVASQLVHETSHETQQHTKTAIKEAVKATQPPYGRGKAITEAVMLEYKRQRPIHWKRRIAHIKERGRLAHEQERRTRLNRAYAHAFSRPLRSPRQSYPGPWGDYEARRKFDAEEVLVDRGDDCIDLTHFRGRIVCLVKASNDDDDAHIATIRGGVITRTYFRTEVYGDEPENLVDAALQLGGPKVKTAISLGKKVITDWTGRRTLIHHEGQDYQRHWVQELPWRAVGSGENVLILGSEVTPDN